MTKSPKSRNLGASVRDRLLRIAQERGDDFQLLLTRYATERLLARLASSPHAGQFILKGATLFTVWTGEPHRATRDVDLLGFGDPALDRIRSVFTDLVGVEVEPDGVELDPSMTVEPIREDQEYGGVRVIMIARIAGARIRLQIDVGFGDAVTPAPTEVQFPALLDFPAPRLRAYPRETVVAEKLEALVQLGIANSRMKDFYDLAVLATRFAFDGGLLVRAVRATFERRGTALPTTIPVALTREFTEHAAKRAQWTAFVRKADIEHTRTLAEVAAEIARFAMPLFEAAVHAEPWLASWQAGGPWTR